MTDKLAEIMRRGWYDQGPDDFKWLADEIERLRATYQHDMDIAAVECQTMNDHVKLLREQNEALHDQIDYIRSLVWNGDPSVSDTKIVDDLRGLLDRPKLGRKSADNISGSLALDQHKPRYIGQKTWQF